MGVRSPSHPSRVLQGGRSGIPLRPLRSLDMVVGVVVAGALSSLDSLSSERNSVKGNKQSQSRLYHVTWGLISESRARVGISLNLNFNLIPYSHRDR